MNQCTRLSDRMPEVAAGRTPWQAEEARHLLACPACAAEWRLVGAAAGLGREVGQRMDPAGMAVSVANRLRAAPAAAAGRASWIRRVAVPGAAAAAIALAVWFGLPASGGPGEPVTIMAVLPELDGLEASELESLVEDFAEVEDPTIRPLEAPQTLDDLTDSELESLLRMMEG